MDPRIVQEILTDRNKFDIIIDAYYNELFVYVYNQFENVETAKDLVQEIFMKLYNNLNKYNSSKASFRTWMYRVSTNYCLNYRRDNYKHQYVKYDFNLVRSSEDIIESLVNHEQVELVLSVMDKVLKSKHKKIMLLHFFGQLSLEEISESVGLAKKTVSNVITLSIKKIKNEIGVISNV